MVLHCASRVGFLSYLYQQRQEIAYALGLITEIPIAMCSSDYDFNDDLVIHAPHHENSSGQTIPVALEITLFFSAITLSLTMPEKGEVVENQNFFCSRALTGCLQAIFHPPAHLS
jgi:hypothetical protein